MSVRVLIVDDSEPFLDAARALLEREGLTVAGLASTGADALRLTAALQPDVVLLDVFLGEENGFDVAQRVVDGHPDGPAVIMTSTYERSTFEERIAEAPVAAFLPKEELSASAILQIVSAR